ncbi:chemotaxis protein CheA [Caulobacter endophyticus]|uniref:Chemotaxis protein CheA n=1 Tax=Caulobacter endophyticus TaxID=2172652 RepID=A0A2T9JGW7_9CAUL|nr:chemotaxis protein CheA [Caulobacter endophyticus]PVM82932.1 chemotaxis protein CheA [Caulobacter endophyticus]
MPWPHGVHEPHQRPVRRAPVRRRRSLSAAGATGLNDDLLPHFLIEGRDLTEQAAHDLQMLARGPDKIALDSCFRAIHTLKGSAALFDLPPMVRLLHAAEDLLGAMRSGATADPAALPALIEVVDQTDRWLDELAASAVLKTGAEQVEKRLAALMGRAPPPEASDTDPVTTRLGGVAIRYTPRADCYFAGDDPLAIIRAVPGLVDLRIAPREPFGDLARYDPFTCNLVMEAVSTAERGAVEAALRLVADQVVLSELAQTASVETVEAEVRTLRVAAERVDHLSDLTDELVIAKGGLALLAAQAERLAEGHVLAQALRAQQARLDRLVGELHGTVGRIRQAPLAPLFNRFPRLVREVARSLGKTVSFEVEGGETEVDKAVVDGLYEPLLHVLRNALDHGIETPAMREASGKSAASALRLSARSAGDRVVIEVIDDGAGMDPRRIQDMALARGLIDESQAAALDDRAALELIFLPGFSTAATASDLSGRGVGMDAVRSAVARLGGRVEIASQVGKGSTIRLVLPISMALTKIMVVTCSGERFGLAIEGVAETARVAIGQLTPVRDTEAFVLRDQVVPLVHLADLVGASRPTRPEVLRVVVAKVGDESVGIVVDAVVDRLDATIRPMSGLLVNAPGVNGSTLLADGTVLMVLDLQELVG